MSTHSALAIPTARAQWEVISRTTPKAGPREILIKNFATALNPVDWKMQKYGLFTENLSFPAVLGSDSAGTVEEIGEGVTSFVKGDRVVYHGFPFDNNKATFQQYLVAPAEIVSKIPSSISFEEAATVPLGLATAAIGLYDPDSSAGFALTYPWVAEGKNKYKGRSIVIFGGSSSVGQYAIQLAALSGFSTIITTASTKHEAHLKSLGATHVIDRSGDVVAQIKKLLPGGATDLVYDAISSKDTHAQAVNVSTSNASVAITLPPDGVDFGDRKVINISGSVHLRREVGVNLYSYLFGLLETGTIKPNRFEVVPGGLKGIVDGLERMSKDQVSGVKLVTRLWE